MQYYEKKHCGTYISIYCMVVFILSNTKIWISKYSWQTLYVAWLERKKKKLWCFCFSNIWNWTLHKLQHANSLVMDSTKRLYFSYCQSISPIYETVRILLTDHLLVRDSQTHRRPSCETTERNDDIMPGPALRARQPCRAHPVERSANVFHLPAPRMKR